MPATEDPSRVSFRAGPLTQPHLRRLAAKWGVSRHLVAKQAAVLSLHGLGVEDRAEVARVARQLDCPFESAVVLVAKDRE